MTRSRPVPLSEADQDAIFALVPQGLSARRIAAKIGRPPTTVAAFMIRNALRPRSARRFINPFKRGDHRVVPYAPGEDALMVSLRIEGLGFLEIARRLSDTFVHRRTRQSVYVRLQMLASFEEVEDQGTSRTAREGHRR